MNVVMAWPAADILQTVVGITVSEVAGKMLHNALLAHQTVLHTQLRQVLDGHGAVVLNS